MFALAGSNPYGVRAILRSRAGFTLLEVLLVLGIVAILAGLVLTGMDRPMANRRLSIAADEVRAAWMRAHNRAMATGTPYRFRCLLEDNQYIIECAPADASSAAVDMTAWQGATVEASDGGLPPVYRTVQRLPEDVVFALLETSDTGQTDAYSPAEMSLVNSQALRAEGGLAWETGENVQAATQEGGPVLFFPDGTATSARVTLRNKYDRALDITLRGLTCTTSVSEPYSTAGGAP